MTERDIGLTDQARQAFCALSADQRGFIYRRVAGREHKHHYFGTLFDALHIGGFSRPHLASSWVGKFPQQRIDSFLQTPEGNQRFKGLLSEFFRESHRQMNDRFLELFNSDKEGRCAATGERSLVKLGEEVAQEVYWPLYEAAMHWLILPKLPEKADDPSVDLGPATSDEIDVSSNQLTNEEVSSRKNESGVSGVQSDSQEEKIAELETRRKEIMVETAPQPSQSPDSASNFSAADAQKLNQLLRDIEALSNQASDLRVTELSTVAKRLQAALSPLPDLEAQLVELSGRLKKKISLLKRINWLDGFTPTEPVDLQKQTVVKLELKRLQDFDGELGQLLQLGEQITTLEGRLEEPLPSWSPPQGVGLKEIVEACEKRISEISRRIETASEQEKTFVDFVDAFATTNEDTGPHLLDSVGPDEFRDIGLEILRRSSQPDSAETIRRLRGRADVAGLILAHLWGLDAAEGLNLVKLSATTTAFITDRSGIAKFLSFLNYGQLRELASQVPQYGPSVAELLFSGAVCHGRTELLEYLDSLLDIVGLHPLCAAFYRSIIDGCHRGHLGNPRSWLGTDSEARSAVDNARIVEHCRQDLLDFVQRSPGMSKTYHRMRVYARSKFLRPLEQAIESREVAQAISLWEAHGTIESMVEDCAKAFEGPNQLDQSHYQQIRRYISSFEEKLLGWQTLTRHVHVPPRVGGPIRDAVSSLRREVNRGSQSNPYCRSLLHLLEQMANGENNGNIPAEDFGERCDTEMRVHVDPGAKSSLVNPFMTRSWPAVVAEESVALGDLLHDFLRCAISANEIASHELVHNYVQRGQVEAARRMGELRAEWAEAFAREVECLTAAFRLKNADLLGEAGEAREADRDISDCLVEIENALANSRFGEADDWVGYLTGLVGIYRKRRDPVSTSLREFLAEIGQSTSEDTGQDELREMVRIARIQNGSHRVFVEAMSEAAQEPNWPAGLRTRWSEVATQIDKPRFWQQPECAMKLADAIRVFSKYLTRKLKWREKDPSTTDAIVDRLGEWVTTRLTEVVEKKPAAGDDVLKQFLGLANDVNDDCPSAHVLQIVGDAKETLTPSQHPPVVVSEVIVVDEEQKPVVAMTSTSEQLVSELRAEMRKLLPKPSGGTGGDTRALKAALARRDWNAARTLAAEWLDGHANQLASDMFNDTEAVCMLCAAGGVFASPLSPGNERLWLLGCLGLGAADTAVYYLTAETQEELAAKYFASLAGRTEVEGATAFLLKAALEQLDDLPPTEVKMRPVAELFRIGSQLSVSNSTSASARFARIIWNGLRDNYKPRAGLLHLLFKLGHLKVIESLADTAKPYQQLVVNCVRAFAHAESNPEARAHGQQLRKALEDLGGLRPWRLFIKNLDIGQSAQDEAAVDCQLESEFVTQQPGGRRTIELRLSPSLSNPPKLLEMKLGGENSKFGKVVIQDEPLFGERTITLVVPPDFQPLEGGIARISFEITGETIFEKPVLIRGAWDVKFDDKPAVPIPHDEITRAWPGASGNPVTRDKGFHGREKELDAICAYVEATPRPRSVMVFGQRRIGKTSLAREAVTNFDLDHDGVAAAFFDISGLTFSKDGSGMATAFFRYLVSQLRGPDNAHLKTWFGTGAHERLEQRLQGLNPESSLLDCFDSMAQHLGELSRGRVRRFALVIDEFDRFVEPLLGGHRELVQQFLWNLRSVVQRAERVSLILAGSGLQKLLVQGYEDALFGSIDEVHVEPFTWKEDSAAVLDTVFPADLRARLCRAQDAEKLAEKACELCGGHPMYLALLGSAAAILSGGRRLSADTLNRVVERLVQEGVNEPCLQIDRKRFYNPTFQTLAKLPVKTQALARLILVHIAERTTPEYPWESVANAIATEVLPRNVPRSDGLDALKRLEEERVVTRDKSRSRVRITVPLTANCRGLAPGNCPTKGRGSPVI